MKALTRVGRFFDVILYSGAVVSCVLFVFITLSVNAEIVMRYFLRRPIIWVVEISENIMLFIVFLSAAWVLKKEGHINVELLLNRLKPKTQALVNGITSIVGTIAFLPIVWYGVQVTWDYYQRGVFRPTSLEIPDATVLFIIPLGSLFFVLQYIRRAYVNLRWWRDH